MKKLEGFQKGVNLGGWISQFDRYDTVHFDTFITRADIEEIAGIGFDHVRVPVDAPAHMPSHTFNSYS